MTVGQHQFLRQLVSQGFHSVLVAASPALALPQVPLQQALVGLQLSTQLSNAGLGLLQAQSEGLYACSS